VIDRPALTAWRSRAPWPDRVQVEQDLLLSRLMIEIARDELLGPELAMRGGTCFHKLHLPTALRYSEDLDYVRSTHTGVGPYAHALTRIAEEVGLAVSSQRSGQLVHVQLEGQPTEGLGRIRLKVEINIAETESFEPRKSIHHAVESSWWSGRADILTFEAEELLATKLRALYQRSKGRDLFDLWLGLTVLGVNPERVVGGLQHYMRGAAFSFPELRNNLTLKLADPSFRRDLDALVASMPAGYEPDSAGNVVVRELGGRLRNAPPLEEIAPLRS
jgi:predicted nucleotidyltransferase component of viral defense system